MADVTGDLESLKLDSIKSDAAAISLEDFKDKSPEDLKKLGHDPAELMREALASCDKKTQAGLSTYLDLVVHKLFKNPSSYLPTNTLNCLKELKHLQEQQDCFESQHHADICRIKSNYLREIEPLCSKRKHLVSDILRFWLSVMRAASDELNKEITERDAEALEYLRDIRCIVLDDNRWVLEFEFDDSNPYFRNRVLTKEVLCSWYRGKLSVDETKGTEIEWNDGKCLTRKVVQKMHKKLLLRDQSFFNLFSFNQKVEVEKRLIHNQTFIERIVCPSVLGDQLAHDLQLQFHTCTRKMSEHMLAAEAVYLKNVEPLLDRRRDLVADVLVAEPSPLGEEKCDVNFIGEFWLYVMTAEETISPMISVRDAKVLRYLKDVKFSRTDDGWMNIEFLFNPNPYFENCVLSKTMPCCLDRVESIGTEIQWRPNAAFFTHDGEVFESFFNLFNGSMDEGYSVEDFNQDLKVCEIIRTRIMPHAASFYLDPNLFEESLRHAFQQSFHRASLKNGWGMS